MRTEYQTFLPQLSVLSLGVRSLPNLAFGSTE
jgi:hypothetical protein